MNTKRTISPCQDCLIIPVCRHKKLHNLISDCSFVRNLFYDNWNHTKFWEDITYVENILKPTQWSISSTIMSKDIERRYKINETINKTM